MVLEGPLVMGLVAMIGIHAPVHGETVRAYVTLHPEQPAGSEPDLIACAQAPVGCRAPVKIRMLEMIPRNATDRIDCLAVLQLATAAVRVD